MMRRSIVPEIAALADEELPMDEYWNDTSDNIEMISEQDNTREERSTSRDNASKGEKLKLHLLPVPEESDKQTRISPNLTYDIFMFPKVADFENNRVTEKFQDNDANEKTTENELEEHSATSEDQLESSLVVLQR